MVKAEELQKRLLQRVVEWCKKEGERTLSERSRQRSGGGRLHGGHHLSRRVEPLLQSSRG